MSTLAVRDLRNDVSAILRQVEAGASFTIAVRGRPVAQIVPLARRPESMPWSTFLAAIERAGADAGLRDELAGALADTTDDA
jgi:prevent-host-death family protein